MAKSPDAFRSIGEVSRLVGVAPHVLRYWEGQFIQLSPVKRADGRRYYRPDDVRLVAGLCQVLREEGLSIRGAKLLIAADRGARLREIGAARLGESLPYADGRQVPLAGPAVRLARPAQSTAAVAAPRSAPPLPTDRPAPPPAAASGKGADRPAKPPTPRRQAAPLPLFPETAPPFLAPSLSQPAAAPWLARLITASDHLRQLHLAGQLTPERAAALRGPR